MSQESPNKGSVMPTAGQYAGDSVGDEVSFRDLVGIFWRGKWLIVAVTAVSVLIAVGAVLIAQKEYTTDMLIAPASEDSSRMGGMGSLVSQFGGLASLAGISVGGSTKKVESLAILQSGALAENYIRNHNLIPVLFSDLYDAKKRAWKTKNGKSPTLWQAQRYFRNNVIKVSEDAKTGLATLSVTWTDPAVASQWANDLVKITNNFLREKAARESERNIAYLNEQVSKTTVVEVRKAIYALLENEIKASMLARGNEEYALKVIDPAVAPERPSSPKPLLWVAIGVLGGGLLSAVIVLVRHGWVGGARKEPEPVVDEPVNETAMLPPSSLPES